MIYNVLNRNKVNILPKASDVLYCYLKNQKYPHWTSFFVSYKDVINDQFNKTYFIEKFKDENNNNNTTIRYLIVRTGCFPFIKYHCSKLAQNELIDERQIKLQDRFFTFIKVINFGSILFLISIKKKRSSNSKRF
jgi:hypothetical protein